jgi:hypothetical protein
VQSYQFIRCVCHVVCFVFVVIRGFTTEKLKIYKTAKDHWRVAGLVESMLSRSQ